MNLLIFEFENPPGLLFKAIRNGESYENIIFIVTSAGYVLMIRQSLINLFASLVL